MVLTLKPARRSRVFSLSELLRDLLAPPGVRNDMTVAAWPRTHMWEVLLSKAKASDDFPSPSSSPGPGSRYPARVSLTDDDDLLSMGAAEALAELTRRHADAAYRVALSVTRDHALAEDVTQDALLKAWQALPTFRGQAPLKNWLLRITHNTAVSALRRRRDVHVDPEDLPEAPLAEHRSVERQVEARASIAAFEEALGSLDDLSRSIVVLREVEGMSYDEIAAVLEVPLPTVKTRLLRARRLLTSALGGWRP